MRRFGNCGSWFPQGSHSRGCSGQIFRKPGLHSPRYPSPKWHTWGCPSLPYGRLQASTLLTSGFKLFMLEACCFTKYWHNLLDKRYKYGYNLCNLKIWCTSHSLLCSHQGNQYEIGRKIKEELVTSVYSSLDFPGKITIFSFLFPTCHQRNNRYNKSNHQVTGGKKLGVRWHIMLCKLFLFWELL